MNPWDIAPLADYPQSAKVISLHRATVVPLAPYRAARATRDAGMLAALNERAEEIAYDDFVRADGRTRLGTPTSYPAGKCRSVDRERTGPMVRRLLPRSRGGCGASGCEDHSLAGVPFGERLVLFFRLNGEALTFWFAMASIGLLFAAVVGAWMGVGR